MPESSRTTGFPAPLGIGNREAWDAVAEGFLDEPLRFEHSYSLVTSAVPAEEQACPFYLNDGFVLFAREYFDRFAPLYLETRPDLSDRLVDPYYAGQVALALSAARVPLPSVALPMRFNFPNDPVAAEQYPEELESVVVFHYLREDQFNRQQIFRWRETYSAFLTRPLHPANARFRDSVRSLLGEEYPFDHIREPDVPEWHDQPAPCTERHPERRERDPHRRAGAACEIPRDRGARAADEGEAIPCRPFRLGGRLDAVQRAARIAEDSPNSLRHARPAKASTRVATGYVSPRRSRAAPRSESRG